MKGRLAGLQTEKSNPEAAVRKLIAGLPNVPFLRSKEIGQEVTEFMVNLEKRFEQAPTEERKESNREVQED